MVRHDERTGMADPEGRGSWLRSASSMRCDNSTMIANSHNQVLYSLYHDELKSRILASTYCDIVCIPLNGAPKTPKMFMRVVRRQNIHIDEEKRG